MFEGTKRLLAMLLACTLALGTLTPMTAYAEELGAAPEEKPDAFIDPVEEEGTDCSLDHTWDDADCDTPKTCSVCGATEGDALGHTWADADCDTPKTCSVCGATEGDALGHTWDDADCDTPKTCSVCGATEGDALGHSWQEAETVKVCTVCGTEEKIQTQQPEDGENDILIIADEDDLKVESYSAFMKELKVLEGYADAFAAGNSKYSDPNVLVVNFIRTGVERYQTVYWSGLAGSEITAFTEYVRQQDADNGTTAMALRNIVIEDFKLPNGNPADFGHMSGTMNILYCNNSQNSHDIGGWAGDICDLLLYSRDHGDVPEGTVDEMAAFILEKCFGVDADDAFGWDDFYGDLDAYYLVREWKKGGKSLSGLMEEYFTADLDDQDRSAYFLNHRFTGLKTQQDVRDAVYNAYIGNTAIEILEGDSDRNLTDVNPDLRKAACYAFADYVYTQAGDRLGEDTGEEPDPEIPTDPSEPEEEPENPYYEDFSVSKSFLAPGISQSIHYALSADNKQMAYYVATVDVTRDDVTIMANYRNADPTQGWGMSRVMDQAEALTAKHSNPDDAPNYIENFSVVVATNGDGYNMSTGEPGGLLVMGGVEYHPVDKDGFFAILKDGSAMIGTRADYDIYKDQIQEAIGGFGATLVKDGKIVANPADTTRASRTAVGITATGAVVMMVLDGRQEPFSCGGSMAEIAQIMYEAGCVHAINLDGGGSTTYASKPEGADKLQLVNRPSDGYARSVAATLAAISTSKVTNEFDHANISADYDYLTIGTSVTVTAVGVSTSGNAAPIPEDAQWVVSDETIGTITQEGVFTAVENGEVEVSLIQGEKVLGKKTLNVVIPDAIAFEKENYNAIYGVPVRLGLNLFYNGNTVAYNNDDILVVLEDESAATLEDMMLTGIEESGVRNLIAGAVLMSNFDLQAMTTISFYKDGEAIFDFDDITGGTRELAWKRGISNSTTQDSVIYNIDDPTKPMDITYVFGLDMETIEFPEKLEEIRYMLGGEAGSTAWDYMLMFAERISVLTEVIISARFDKNLVIDYSDLSFRNDYFNLTSATLDEETNTLTIKCNWVDQTQAIDPATANPTCILSGIKATTRDGGWDELGQMNIINSGSIGYDVYARFSSLYSFACKEENQEKYGLYPYSVQTDEISYNGGPEQGGHFSSTYAEFEDHFTLDKSMRQGWYTINDQMFYFVDHVALTGIQKVPSHEDPSVKLFYDFGEDGACTGKITGLFDYDGGKCYAVLGKMMTGWQSMYDRDGNAVDYYFDKTTGKAVNGVQTIAGYTYTFEDYVLVRGDLVTDETGTRYRWAGQWVYGKWFEVDGNTYHVSANRSNNFYVTTGYSHIVGQDLEYHWHLFDENGVFQKDYTGKYHVGNDTYYLKNGVMVQEPGLIYLDGYYYYFCSTGKAVKNCTYWPTKTNGLLPMGPYVFDEEGRMTNPPGQTPDTPDTPDTPQEPAEKKNGIHTVNGKLYYYVDDMIQYAAGVVQLEDGSYIYVRSNGQLAVGAYWVTNTNGLMDQGMHNFDENGIMTDPPVAEPEQPDVPVDPNPDDPDQPEKPEVKEGIIEENGILYYYENGTRAYAKGLVKLQDEEGNDFYIYVRSNGQLAIGSYWVTNDNGLLPQQMYNFGEDGKMLNPPVTEPEDPDTPDQPDTPVVPEPPVVKHGIVEENGVLYYYENGTRAYAKGVVKLVDEAGVTYYIYVRSNAQLALGNYWTTNHNGLLAEKMYNFGTDGRYYPA